MSSTPTSGSACMDLILRAVDDYFEVSGRGSTILQELRGGFASFLTMSYILLVNPQILTAWLKVRDDNPQDWLSGTKASISQDIATATALTCGMGSILVGCLSKMPFTIGPGMGLNTFVAGLLITTYAQNDINAEQSSFLEAQKTWAEVCTTTFLVGVLLTVMSGIGIVAPVISSMPETIKTGIMVGIGAYQAFIGLREMGIIVGSADDLVSIESFDNESFSWDPELRAKPVSAYAQIFFVVGLFITAVLFHKNVKGSILVGIAVCTALSWATKVGGGEFPLPPVSSPQFSNNTFATLDFRRWFSEGEYLKKFLPEVFVIIIITVFDCGGVQFGVAKLLDLPKRYSEVEAIRKKQRHAERSERTHLVYNGAYEDDDSEEDIEQTSNTSNSIANLTPNNQKRFSSASAGSLERGQEIKRLEHQLRQVQALEAEGVDGLADAKDVLRESIQRLSSFGVAQAGGGVGVGGISDSALPQQPSFHPSINDADYISEGTFLAEKTLLPGRSSQMTFISVGIANILGSFLGSSPCIVFLECAAGVKEGARTGLSSVFAGSMFLVTVFLTPVFQKVPLCASAGPLVFIGCLMMSHIGEINWGDLMHALPAFLTILMMPFTSSITPGIGFGLATYVMLRGLVWLFDACVGPFQTPPPLHAAVRLGEVAEVQRLVADEGVDLEARDFQDNTALHVAASVGNQEVIQVLLSLGADPNAVNGNNMTPLEISLDEKNGAYSSLAAQSLQEAAVR